MAVVGGERVGLAMLKTLETGEGYVYYIAVARAFRRRGVASLLLDDALAYFSHAGAKAVYASVENEEATRLFTSKGFARTDFSEVSRAHGLLKAISLYRSMLAVPGETLLRVEVGPGAGGTTSFRA